MLLLSNIIKKSRNGLEIKATKLFAKISTVLGFKHISYHYDVNKSVGNIKNWTKNVVDIKGN